MCGLKYKWMKNNNNKSKVTEKDIDTQVYSPLHPQV